MLAGLALPFLALFSAYPVGPAANVTLGAGMGLLGAAATLAGARVCRRIVRHLRLTSLGALLASEPDPAFVTDSDGRILRLNDAARALPAASGQPLARALRAETATPEALVARLGRAAAREGLVREVLAGGDAPAAISAQRAGPGLVLWRMETDAAPGLRAVLDEHLPVVRVDGADRILSVNAAAASVFGSPERLADLTHPRGPDDPEKPGGPGGAFRPVTLGRRGRERDILFVPDLGSPGGHLIAPPGDAAAGTWTDTLETLPVPVIVLDAEGTVTSANAPARQLLSLSEGQTPPLYDLVEGMGRPISQWLSEAGAGRGLLKPEFVRATLPDHEVYIQISLGRIEIGGKARLVGVLTDATELKTLEAQFVQSQKMQAIGQLAGGVAHDFNNLLTAISGHCDLLLLRHDESDPDYSDLTQIAQNANRAASLVGQLLAFSRKQNLKPQALDLREVMSDLTHLLNRLIGERVTLDLKIDRTDRVIHADRRQFEQVIMNLVVNARDAMPDGGTIGIRVRTENFPEAFVRDRATVHAGEYVVMDVSDEGVGIDPDRLPKIFEPFYTTKKTGEGTGLGLSTAYGIVKQTGGFIFADSTVGQGTTFTLYFPAHARQPAQTVSKAENDCKPRLMRPDGVVLLVEDEAPVRAFASRALRMRGFTVLEAESAEKALELLEDGSLRVDVFVTDVIMPGLDGPTWIRRALETRPDSRVVFMSGYAEESLAENQARVPNSVFLPKPFSLGQLTSVVESQLR